MSHFSRYDNGFTLIELLAAIAIIGVLSALALVGMGRVRESSRRVTCASNLRQTGVLIQLYSADYKGRLPGPVYRAYGPYARDTDANALTYKLQPYLGPLSELDGVKMRIALFECPSWSVAISKEKQDKGRCYIVQGSARLTNGAGVQPFGYPGDNGEQPHQIHEIEAPSRTWAITDLDEVNGAPNYTNSADPGIAVRPVHGNVRNALYFDGHVGTISSS